MAQNRIVPEHAQEVQLAEDYATLDAAAAHRRIWTRNPAPEAYNGPKGSDLPVVVVSGPGVAIPAEKAQPVQVERDDPIVQRKDDDPYT